MIDRQAARNGLWGTRPPAVWFTAVVALATLVMALARAAHVIADAQVGGNQFQDDAFYYLVIARNLVLHGLLSFDGVHVTNGFHPLWMGVVVLLQIALGPDVTPTQQVLAVTWVEQALYVTAVACSGLFALRAARESSACAAGFLAVGLMLASPLAWVFRQGMETTLAMLILLVVLQLLVARAWLAVGVGLGLLVLARLDTAVFVAAPLLAFVWTQQRGLRPRLIAALPAVAVVLADVLANLALQGHAVPISGALRSSFPWPSWEAGFLMEPLIIARQYGWWGLAVTYNLPLVLVLLVVGLVTMLMLPRGRRVPATVWAIWVTAFLLTANLVFFQRWEKSTDPRYFALPMLAALFAALTALARAARFPVPAIGQRPLRHLGTGALFGGAGANVLALGLLVAMLLAGNAAWRATAPPAAKDPLTALMQDVDRTLPPDAVIAGTDVGALAFWTRRRVIDLDGLVNDFAFQDVLRDQHLGTWLAAEGVTHIATPLFDRAPAYLARPMEPMYKHAVDARALAGGAYGTHRFYVYSYLHGRYSDALELAAADEVFRREVEANVFNRTAYVIYAWHPPRPGVVP